VEELADICQVSEQTIYRDINKLREQGRKSGTIAITMRIPEIKSPDEPGSSGNCAP